MNYWFSSDHHFGHKNIIRYCNRPFDSVNEMDETLITNYNSVVKKEDIVIFAGDFTLLKNKRLIYEKYINRLNGKHVFLLGSHDYWMNKKSITRWEKKIGDHYVVVDHYAMHTWARSHYNSFHLFGHSHGKLDLPGKRWDCGVDNNDFYPISFDQVIEIMKKRDDNPNLIRR